MKAFCFAAVIVLSIATHAQEWTRFRGPNGSGVSDANVPVKWSAGDYNWQVELPGAGHSSPVIWGEKIFLTSAEVEKGERHLLCLSAKDGSLQWQASYPFEKYKKHGNNSYATNTPACDGERVYSLWQSRAGSALVAHDHAGKEQWSYDMGPFTGGHGAAISPIVYAGMVIVGNDQEGPSFLAALDAATGKERWRVTRKSSRATYATPCVYEVADREPEIIFTDWEHGITGVKAASGEVAWEIDLFGDFKQRAIGSPVIADRLVIGTSGFTTAQKNVVAVLPDEKLDAKVGEVYRLSKSVPHIPTPLVYKDWLFLWTDTGIVSCADHQTGKQLWQKRVGGNYSGSPICAGGRLYCMEDSGRVVVLAAGDEYELLAENELGQPTRSTPAVSGGVLYLRTESHLISLGGK